MKTFLLASAGFLLLVSCNGKKAVSDASGTFEGRETIVSAEATGRINSLVLEEGQLLEVGDTVGHIDSLQLYLKKKQLQAQINAVLGRKPDIPAQLAAYREQLKQALREQDRLSNLVKADAATPKQLDDANAQVAIIRKQIAAQESSLGISSSGLNKEALPLTAQIEQLNDQLAKTNLINGVKGTVLTKYVEAGEMAVAGKPLYKIADLSTIVLRAYFTVNQLSSIKLGQVVKVLVDASDGQYKTYEGVIEWISARAEFTPKTIQTKEERANLVYAAKIRLKNDGYLKIGMYAEVGL
ncbi:HlyD family secretion protein [Pedobacter steynii]|uniref:HlyD family secretion protein n=1 Tax=Pedobacter steynii TaxID=430522 RepID=A0A1H0ABI4_9SPHI|nr:HlyD family efflux transporter periplasmic adaptor subunit [Pedobacter steynii]NQX41408.1 efflux RND transporter periplasmic adaptor subunit [Pedobacter steynii]SDN30835.1 HlyD family secretion protein [Pedobacter steynii]